MGGEQAAKTLVEVKQRQLEKQKGESDSKLLEQVYQETLQAYKHQMSAYYATSEIWDDGILDPVDTRNALGISLSAAMNAPFSEAGYGVFRL